MQYLVTGSSGFIGYHLAKKILDTGNTVICFDNENNYYDIELKRFRRSQLEAYENYIFIKGDLADNNILTSIFKTYKVDVICHLGAQAGVRYSIENPAVYIQSNLVGFANIIELAKKYKVQKFIYASSSSVYGNNTQPFSLESSTDNPVSLYAATKKSNELIAHSYSHLFGLSTIGLRFFSVYGPLGRPDMAYYDFINKLYKSQPINIFGDGESKRDFTYIDDIVEGIMKAIAYENVEKYSIFNLGNDNPISVNALIAILERHTGRECKKNYMQKPLGDADNTRADISQTKTILQRSPKTSIEVGLESFVKRYKAYNKID